MKVAVDTIDLTDDDLKSIRRFNNQHGKATRAEAKAFLSQRISDLLADVKENWPPNSRPKSVA